MSGPAQHDYWESPGRKGRRHPTHPVIEAYVLPKIELISRRIGIGKDTRLLDVGCGNGYFTYHFSKICDTSGVDYSRTMLDINPVKNTYLMDASALKFEDSSFDVVFCHALLHHVEDPAKVVSEMARVARRHVVIIEPNRDNPLVLMFSLLKKEERGAMKFSMPYLKGVVERAGLAIDEALSFGIIVPNKTPASWLAALRPFDRRQPLGVVNIVIAEKRN